MGILSSIMDIGQSTGPMVVGALVGAYSYQTAFGIVGIGLVVVSLVFGFIMRYFKHHDENRQMGKTT
jgi:dipeptide/tripeptide permease